MRNSCTWGWNVALLLWLVVTPITAASDAEAQTAEPAPIPVTTVAVALQPIARSLTTTGRVAAIDRVELRARVDGFLETVVFTEGDRVAEGDLLYRIERDLFEAAARQAEGVLEQARAEKILADLELGRAEELLEKDVGTVRARDVAKANADKTAGAVSEAEAQLATAKINLGYTEIHAPVSGRIGRTTLTKGAVVGPSSGVLTVIVSEDPIYVTFPVSAREFLRGAENTNRVDPSAVRVRLRFPEGEFYRQEGRVDFVGVSVDQTTDTVMGRTTLANPDLTLIDGQLVTVHLEAGNPVEKPVIPQSALIADQGGIYVFAVEDGKAAVRRIKTGNATGSDIVVEQGLAAGDMVVVGGIEHLRPGVPVMATPAVQQGGN